jgi:hypothetical protein
LTDRATAGVPEQDVLAGRHAAAIRSRLAAPSTAAGGRLADRREREASGTAGTLLLSCGFEPANAVRWPVTS